MVSHARYDLILVENMLCILALHICVKKKLTFSASVKGLPGGGIRWALIKIDIVRLAKNEGYGFVHHLTR